MILEKAGSIPVALFGETFIVSPYLVVYLTVWLTIKCLLWLFIVG